MVTSVSVKRFLVEKFWNPIVNESVFYNPFNTAAYSLIFALAAAYIGYPLLKKLDISLDRRFFTGIAPFVFFGAALRSLKDINAVNTIALETPFIYILMFGFVALSIMFSRKLEDLRDIEYHKILGAIGTVSLLLLLPFYSINNMRGFAMIAMLSLGVILTGYLLLKSFRPSLLEYSFSIPVLAHYMDASVTSVALTFPSTAEKHVLARFFVDLMGPFGMFVMKSLIIVPAVYYINENMEADEKRYYLFLIAVLGFAIATRNFLSFVTLSG
ncbi:MAG: DUF63 family protein [Candidatus Nanohaloarchaea archaeon]